MTLRLFSTVFACLAPLAAQDMPVPDGQGRLLRLFDLDRALPAAEPAELAAGVAQRPASWDASIAGLLRAHVEPPLGAGDDLTVLGGRWLALLGRPAQIASLERLLDHAAAHRQALVDTATHVVRMPATTFDRMLRPKLVARTDAAGKVLGFETVVPAANAAALLTEVTQATGAEVVTAPRLLSSPLQRCSLQIVRQIPFVKDFELERQGDRLVAEPIVETTWDGVQSDLCAVLLADGLIAVHCDVRTQTVVEPIAEFTTDLGTGVPVTIQLPRTSGVHLRQTAHLAPGDLAVLAAQRADGEYLVTLISATLQDPTADANGPR